MEVKKLLFTSSILELDDDVGTNDAGTWHSFKSPVYDLLLTLYDFGHCVPQVKIRHWICLKHKLSFSVSILCLMLRLGH